ncbi:MAG: discoidin domain-containing protein, partial [Draconibacterium sp.]|nr:discoidin domain-containing protein [Draconibacterium sp.]
NDPIKTLSQCIQGLIYSAGGDGNFLFNVGPDSLGVIEPEQVQRLEEMGQWINRYAEGIYETRGGPFKPSGWGASTHKGNEIYLFIVRWQKGGKITLPIAGDLITKAENLSGENLSLEKGGSESVITVAEDSRDEIATVIRLTIDKPLTEIAPVDMGTVSGSLAFKKPSTSSSIRWNQVEAQGPQQAFDDNPGSHWVPDGKEKEWIEVDLEEIQTVNSVLIEQVHAQYKEMQFQFEKDGEWETIFTETKWEGAKEISFSSVEAQKFRVMLFGGQTHLSELQLFNSNSSH